MEDAERAGLDAERAILLFYHYGAVASDELAWQTEQCERLGLAGRLRIASEGLNGTLSGLRAALTEYTTLVDARVGAARIDWKFGSADISQCFAELSVREVSEVVSLGVDVGVCIIAGEYQQPQPQVSVRGHGRLLSSK